MTIHVVVPTYNCMDFLPRCLDSIAAQDCGEPWDVWVIDDASTDHTQPEFITDYCARPGWTAVLNHTRREAARNIWDAHRLIDPDPDDIIVEVDGDDALAHDGVLRRLAEVYTDPDVWLTYGSYQYWPDPDHWDNPALPYPPEVVAGRAYRQHPVLFNHPETWRAFMWERLAPWELQTPDGEWIRRTWDYAAMMPLLELAGGHWRHLPDTLYLYTHQNPASHVKLPEHQAQAEYEAEVVRSRPQREPIPDDHVATPRRKRDMLLRLRDRYDLGVLIETGTGMGDLLHWCWRHFEMSYSVEFDQMSYEHCQGRFDRDVDVCLVHGDSAVVLPTILRQVRESAVVFLDAHWSGGTERASVDCPVVDELAAILADGPVHAIVIDDARLFGSDPAYPTVDQVRAQVAGRYSRVEVVDDMIVIEP